MSGLARAVLKCTLLATLLPASAQSQLTEVATASGQASTDKARAASEAQGATVRITSSPSSGEIYIDGQYFGNTPSQVRLTTGEHTVRVMLGTKEWLRRVQITSGEITVHAQMSQVA